MSYYQCPKCGKTVHEDDFDHGVPEQCGACYQASAAARLEALKARVRAMSAAEVQAFWKTLVKVGKSVEDLAFAAGYAEGLAAGRVKLEAPKLLDGQARHEAAKPFTVADIRAAVAKLEQHNAVPPGGEVLVVMHPARLLELRLRSAIDAWAGLYYKTVVELDHAADDDLAVQLANKFLARAADWRAFVRNELVKLKASKPGQEKP